MDTKIIEWHTEGGNNNIVISDDGLYIMIIIYELGDAYSRFGSKYPTAVPIVGT